MSKNQVVESQESAVANHATLGDWGESQMSGNDIVIPRILCMQGLSQLVIDDKHDAKIGDLVDSMSEEIIGNCNKKPVQFIPFHLEKILIVSKWNESARDYEFDHIEDITPANEHTPYETKVGSDGYKNEQCMNFYVLRPEDTSMPYVISFKGTSRKSGKVLATQMYIRNAQAGKIPPAYVMELAGTKESNAKGSFYVLNSKQARESTQEECATAFKWLKTIKAGETKAHEEGGGEVKGNAEETRF